MLSVCTVRSRVNLIIVFHLGNFLNLVVFTSCVFVDQFRYSRENDQDFLVPYCDSFFADAIMVDGNEKMFKVRKKDNQLPNERCLHDCTCHR